jgi:uncharacterized protein (DUF58 family)
MAYAGKGATHSKADYARALARSLAALLIRQQDAVGVVTFEDCCEAMDVDPVRAREKILEYCNRVKGTGTSPEWGP